MLEFNELKLVDKVYEGTKKVKLPEQGHRDFTRDQFIATKSHLKKKYKLTYDEYKAIYNKQEGKCAICGVEKPLSGRNGLHLDHNHETEEIRGFLCISCNLSLGHIENNLERLDAFINYIKGDFGL